MKKQATMINCFLFTAIHLFTNYTLAEATFVDVKPNAFLTDESAWPDSTGLLAFSPANKIGGWGCSRASMTVMDSWEVAIIAPKGGATALVTLMYRGDLPQHELLADQPAWSLLIAEDGFGGMAEPQLLRWPHGLAPTDVRPTREGYQIRFHDFLDGTARVFSLGANGAVQDDPPPPPPPVLQPEDMPEGSGG